MDDNYTTMRVENQGFNDENTFRICQSFRIRKMKTSRDLRGKWGILRCLLDYGVGVASTAAPTQLKTFLSLAAPAEFQIGWPCSSVPFCRTGATHQRMM